ncbi:hypothetical protein FOL01_0416 [Weissella jogaejeotgali]|uniref:Uncharacterized protein n=1 Tax=Weissella jogaejeotgali TaxID=1631871 RepID=A0A1L6R9T1_9LACO|nr:hypothetical protein [Weissella jogaejeotgali]APS41275.1 hypothetical protein FOL01_0416 [Weissella jogaejeotgali]
MTSRQERAEKKQRNKTMTIIITLVIVLILLVGGVGWGVSHQLNKDDKIEPSKSSSSISATTSVISESESTSSAVDSESSSVDTESSVDSSEDTDSSVTQHETDMLGRRQMIVWAIDKAMYYDGDEDVPALDHIVEIPNGFTIYYENGDEYNVRDTGFQRNLAPEYNFGENHGWEIYHDHAAATVLKVPQDVGGVVIPTVEDLEQYGIR